MLSILRWLADGVLQVRITYRVFKLHGAAWRNQFSEALNHARVLRSLAVRVGDEGRRSHAEAVALCHIFECHAALGDVTSAVSAGVEAMRMQSKAHKNLFLAWELPRQRAGIQDASFTIALKQYLVDHAVTLSNSEAAIVAVVERMFDASREAERSQDLR
ncbi:MAG: hypothetical protein AB2A00_23940 [Myxococcota bacterium]